MIHTVKGFSIVMKQRELIMTSGPITSWQIEGEKIEVVPDFLSSWALKLLKIVTVAVKLEEDCFLAGKL